MNSVSEYHHYYTEDHLSGEGVCKICGIRERVTDITIIEMEVPCEKFVLWVCSAGHRNQNEIFAADRAWADPVSTASRSGEKQIA